jgi:gamma-glutamyltranspeptidase/glutathione hydrolase
MTVLRRLIALTLAVGLSPLALRADDPPWLVRSHAGMVASDSPEASRIGADILAQGGNAFDAAIAASFALAVSRPQSTGLGGGGFMLAYLAKEDRFIVLDFRETAPAGATREHYAELIAAAGDGPSPTIYGGNAVAVPGQLAGLGEIHKRFATRPLKELVQPAIKLAETGFTVDDHYLDACREALADYQKWPRLKEDFAEVYKTLLGSGQPPKAGQKLARLALARALRLIAEQGPEAVYQGPIGQAMVKAARAAGGVLAERDLASYRVRVREPLRGSYNGYEVVTMPPPSSGGVCILEALNILHAMASDFQGGLRAVHDDLYPPMLVCALKHAFADRARWLGDPDAAPVPAQPLISRDYARQLADRFCPASNEEYGSTRMPEDRGTSHFCVADRDGNAVALTETINGTFGSLVVAEPYGIILNNEMDDFAADPGQPNLYGLIQGEANAVAPGKRPLSSMSPTMVVKAGHPVLVLGASGGPRIITSVLQVMLNVIEFDMPLEQAMSQVRIHHQWLPNEVYFDREPPGELAHGLQQAGHQLSGQRKTGMVQAIQLLPDGTLVGASDPRKGGRPAAP